MEAFHYIQSLAKKYQQYADDEKLLLQKLNSLPQKVEEEAYKNNTAKEPSLAIHSISLVLKYKNCY